MNILLDMSKDYLLRMLDSFISVKSELLFEKLKEKGYFINKSQIEEIASDFMKRNGQNYSKKIANKLVKKIKKIKRNKQQQHHIK